MRYGACLENFWQYFFKKMLFYHSMLKKMYYFMDFGMTTEDFYGFSSEKKENHVKNSPGCHCTGIFGQTTWREKSLAQGVRLFY